MRWLHVNDETIVFVRESADECVLVLATRGDAAVSLPPGAIAGVEAARPLFGDADLALSRDGVALTASGPSFSAFSLPGVRATPTRH
jgi:alpha-glucosidase